MDFDVSYILESLNILRGIKGHTGHMHSQPCKPRQYAIPSSSESSSSESSSEDDKIIIKS